MKIAKLEKERVTILKELFDYSDEDLAKYANEIAKQLIDIFVLLDESTLIGEIHVKYQDDNAVYAAPGIRAMLYAFRIREEQQVKGYGKLLLGEVIRVLKEIGYCEFTIGVEDDNLRAQHIYKSFGFTEFVLRATEEYKGEPYEFNLYLLKERKDEFDAMRTDAFTRAYEKAVEDGTL